MSRENIKENIKEELIIAGDILKAVEILSEKGLYRDAISRLFYFLFYHIKLLLLTKGFEPKTHDGLERLFSQHFVKTRKFDVMDARLLAVLLKYRWNADYNPSFVFTKKDYDELFSGTFELSKKIKSYLKSKKLLN